jgi:hypothetical protein
MLENYTEIQRMKQQKKLFLLVISLVISLLANTIAIAGAGRTGAQILNLGGGTRAASLGDAFSSIGGDVTSIFWNPSGLSKLKETQTILSYTDYKELFGDASEVLYYALFAGASHIEDIGTVGISLQVQGQGTIQVTADSPEVLREENLGTNWALTLSYADQLSEGLSAGVSGKIIRQKLAQYGGRAYAIDFGIQYDFPHTPVPVRVAAAVQNWGTRIKFKDENQSDPLPRIFRSGTAMTLLDIGYHKLQFVADLTAEIDKLREDDEKGVTAFLDQNPDMTRRQLMSERGVGLNAFEWRHLHKSLGVEYSLGKLIFLRVGYKREPGINLPGFSDHLTYGLGFRVYFGQLDYAQIPGGGPYNKRLNVVALKFIF